MKRLRALIFSTTILATFPATSKITLVGDSLSVGVNQAQPDKTVCLHCETGIGINKLIQKVSGKKNFKPRDCTVIFIGTNDFNSGYSEKKYLTQLNRLVGQLNSEKIIFAVPNPIRKDVKQGLLRFSGAYSGFDKVILPITTTEDGIHYRDYKEIYKIIEKRCLL